MTALLIGWAVITLCGAVFMSWVAAADGPGHAIAGFLCGALVTACAAFLAAIGIIALGAVIACILAAGVVATVVGLFAAGART